jgi:acetyl-CoA synthetase
MDDWADAAFACDGLPDGQGLNIAHEAIDRHVRRGAGACPAFRFIDRKGNVESLSYAELAAGSSRFANVLLERGVRPGDSVFGLCERVPALYVAALGALKAGAVFCALFADYGPDPIRVRLRKGAARVLVATDTLYQRKVAEARAALPTLQHVFTVGALTPGAESFAATTAAAASAFGIGTTDPAAPALLHFTSGTTGAPKGAIHAHRAVIAIATTARLALGLGPGDVYWCTADPGWVTGICYGLIAPLACGATAIVDQGDFDAERWYGILADHRVSVWYTAPTALRMLMRVGADLPRRFDLSALRVVASVGEPLNPEVVRWARAALGVPVHDTWWQTETGAIMIANLPGRDVVPGAMGRPVPGITAEIVTRHEGGAITVAPAGEAEGELALKVGWPSMFCDYLKESARYAASFRDGLYLTGDRVRRDAAGIYWFKGRTDEVIKSAGRLVGPFEVESALLEHAAVAEAGVIGKPDPITGETIKAFVALKPGFAAGESLRRALIAHARKRLGPTLAPRELVFCADLPRTRSGKIMRRLLRARELGLPDGDLSALDSRPEG